MIILSFFIKAVLAQLLASFFASVILTLVMAPARGILDFLGYILIGLIMTFTVTFPATIPMQVAHKLLNWNEWYHYAATGIIAGTILFLVFGFLIASDLHINWIQLKAYLTRIDLALLLRGTFFGLLYSMTAWFIHNKI